ncbi:centrosomal protein of 120 kDa [Thalassophryne amazonica]|uniref:centrosomal protein of 120 kDa n=1 Tax=Thalassophryne amazonica TaxID=390379 RepID=UPI0014718F20|nr:centrosomal protein of 120 kDa [Thalassophryne amazonica]
MAPKTEELLLVVFILEGRHFPKTPRLSLVVQASFHGERLATDPVEHIEQPQFCTELAWELDRRMLQQHRLQRTPIKLQCFTVDSVSTASECVGYIVLDLRSVQEVKQEPRWYPLLSSKYTKRRPALLLSMLLESDSMTECSPERLKAKKALHPKGSLAVTEHVPERLEAMLIPDHGYYQVGPAAHCTSMFILSVTVAFASNLQQLISSSRKLSTETSEFYFYFSLLGKDITSKPFHNLLSPEFEPERISVRIRSSKQILQTFLAQQPNLQIELCCGKRSLGSTEVSLSALSDLTVDLDSKAATVEGTLVLQPPKRSQQTLRTLPANLQPTVGVSVILRPEEVTLQFPRNKGSGAETQFVPHPSAAPTAPPADQRPQTLSPVQRPGSPPNCHTESEAESLQDERPHSKEQPGAATASEERQQSQTAAAADVSSVSVSAPKVSVPSSAHHYCFSLDLCSLGQLSLAHPINAVLRYSFGFFGDGAPIMTGPPVELQRNTEVSLSQSYRTFNFTTLPKQLEDTFLRVPLVVEVWHRDSNSRDQLIGTATIQLSRVLRADKSRFMRLSGEQSWRQTHQDTVAVLHTNRPAEKVAELCYVLMLEDLGLVKDRRVIVSNFSQNKHPAKTQLPSQPAAPSVPSVPPGAAPPRDTLEYRTAVELQLWKEQQEDLFDDQLQEKELKQMVALAEEWKMRDRERDALLQKKEMEHNVREKQLQKALADLEKREKQLAEFELETQKLQEALRAKCALSQRELQESNRIMKLECDHQVAMERGKTRLLEEEKARLLQQIADTESRYKQLEKEFRLYREQQNVRPELRLQSEINILSMEKVELERKLESTTKSKLRYKQEWGRALKELARFKQREEESAKLLLKKQEAEIEAMKRRCQAAEEKQVEQHAKQELDVLRNQLNRLKQQEERTVPDSSGTGSAPSPIPNESAEEQLTRLIEERDTLLRTGVYTHQDQIITELNRQIRESMSRKEKR